MRDNDGAMWVSVTRKTLFRVRDDEWIEYGGLDALPRGWPIVATADESGMLWFGYPNDRVARVDGSQVQVFGTEQGLAVGNVLSILAKEGEVWVGGELGLARVVGTRFVADASASGKPFRGISGIVRARNSDLWLNGIDGIVHIEGDEIEGIVRDPRHRLKSETFNYLDGVVGTAVQLAAATLRNRNLRRTHLVLDDRGNRVHRREADGP